MTHFNAKITWRSDSTETFTKNRFTRGHTWSFDGGITVPGSSSPHSVRLPYSVEEAVDPEEALVAATSSCHMLTFLWLAAKAGFNISTYKDEAVGEMATMEDGRQWVARITLNPLIEWVGEIPSAHQLAKLHHEAHEQCFIANSIRSEVGVTY